MRTGTTAGNATTIKLIAARSPLLTHPGQPSKGDWAAEQLPATGPYQASIAEGVNCQLNSCCNYTSKTLPLPPSSTAGQGMGGIKAAATLNSVVRKPGNTYLARPATNGQPHEMTAHPEPRPARLPRGEPPSREMRAINNSAQSSLNPYTTAQPSSCCFLGPPCYRRSEGEMRAINNSTQSSLNTYTRARPDGCCSLGPPCYRRSEGTCVIKSRTHRAHTPAEASVWPECSEHAARCLALQVYPDPSTFAPLGHAQGECTSTMTCACALAARAWDITCDIWDTLCPYLEPIDRAIPSSDYVICRILPSVGAWLLRTLSLASTVWHLHQHNLSRVRHTHERTSTRILDAIGDALDKLKRSEASVATAKLMTTLAVLNTSDSTQAWACLLLALPLYHDHLADTALKVPRAAPNDKMLLLNVVSTGELLYSC